jgi:hypothetical protein
MSYVYFIARPCVVFVLIILKGGVTIYAIFINYIAKKVKKKIPITGRLGL